MFCRSRCHFVISNERQRSSRARRRRRLELRHGFVHSRDGCCRCVSWRHVQRRLDSRRARFPIPFLKVCIRWVHETGRQWRRRAAQPAIKLGCPVGKWPRGSVYKGVRTECRHAVQPGRIKRQVQAASSLVWLRALWRGFIVEGATVGLHSSGQQRGRLDSGEARELSLVPDANSLARPERAPASLDLGRRRRQVSVPSWLSRGRCMPVAVRSLVHDARCGARRLSRPFASDSFFLERDSEPAIERGRSSGSRFRDNVRRPQELRRTKLVPALNAVDSCKVVVQGKLALPVFSPKKMLLQGKTF